MAKLTKREQYLVIGALLFAIVALVAYLYYFPLQDEIKTLDQQSLDLDLQIEEAKNRLVMIETTKQEIAQLEEEIAQQREFLMDTLDVPELLNYVSDIILSSGDLSYISYGPNVDNEIYFSKELGIDFTTSYTDLKNILVALEEGERFTVIPSISISPVGETTEIVESFDDEGNLIETEVPVSLSDVSVNLTARFFGAESDWDGSGEYDFMNGNYGKGNIFK